jgi:hypothetical protein
MITVKYEITGSKGANDFNNLQELKRWLDKNPKIAEKLEYLKKE